MVNDQDCFSNYLDQIVLNPEITRNRLLKAHSLRSSGYFIDKKKGSYRLSIDEMKRLSDTDNLSVRKRKLINKILEQLPVYVSSLGSDYLETVIKTTMIHNFEANENQLLDLLKLHLDSHLDELIN